MTSLDIKEVLGSFDVRAYNATKTWGMCEWEFALSRRRVLFRDPDWYRAKFDVGALVKGLLDSALLPSALREDGPYDPAVIDLGIYAAWGFKEIIESKPNLAAACKAEGEGEPSFHSEHKEGSDDWFRDLVEQTKEPRQNSMLFESFNRLLVEGPFESDTAYVQVMLSAPDELIVEDFRKWLSSIREDRSFEHSPVKRFTETEVRRWSTNQVLPFLDLRLAAWATGTDMPYHTLGEILFPGMDVDVAERTRKVTAPLAEELMTWELGEALAAAANAERRAGKK
ncbi:DUF6387 family protein [Luteimonas sp. A611]